jgi:peptidoglycan/LPS O-acetylase OafA/YrhL
LARTLDFSQHPYAGPKPWAIAITYALVGIVIGWSARAVKRSGAGVSGPAQRARNIGMGVLLAGWVLVYIFEVAFYQTGASIVYGIYPATAPFFIIGLAAAAWAAEREDWPQTAAFLGVATVAAFAALAGPVYCWLIMGIGLCLAMVANAAFGFMKQRRSVVRS